MNPRLKKALVFLLSFLGSLIVVYLFVAGIGFNYFRENPPGIVIGSLFLSMFIIPSIIAYYTVSKVSSKPSPFKIFLASLGIFAVIIFLFSNFAIRWSSWELRQVEPSKFVKPPPLFEPRKIKSKFIGTREYYLESEPVDQVFLYQRDSSQSGGIKVWQLSLPIVPTNLEDLWYSENGQSLFTVERRGSGPGYVGPSQYEEILQFLNQKGASDSSRLVVKNLAVVSQNSFPGTTILTYLPALDELVLLTQNGVECGEGKVWLLSSTSISRDLQAVATCSSDKPHYIGLSGQRLIFANYIGRPDFRNQYVQNIFAISLVSMGSEQILTSDQLPNETMDVWLQDGENSLYLSANGGQKYRFDLSSKKLELLESNSRL